MAIKNKFNSAKARLLIEKQYSNFTAFLTEYNDASGKDLKLSLTQLLRMLEGERGKNKYNSEVIAGIANILKVKPESLLDVSEDVSKLEEYEFSGKLQDTGGNLFKLAREAEGLNIKWEIDMPNSEALGDVMKLINAINSYFEKKERKGTSEPFYLSDIDEFELSSKLNIWLNTLMENNIFVHAVNTQTYDAFDVNYEEATPSVGASYSWRQLTKPSKLSDPNPIREDRDGEAFSYDEMDIFFAWKPTLVLNFSVQKVEQRFIKVNLNPANLPDFDNTENQRKVSEITIGLNKVTTKGDKNDKLNKKG